ncbi:unnamed protein product [marine sediment metagenome]|uniref:Uncharacterized protein n=1 Tax=marine sediment metagenome TaxID=412755 RepID=X1KMT2_9ZZZZ
MIELDLEKVQGCLIWKLRVLAAIRCMCVAHEMDVAWCADEERETARLHECLRKVRKAKGDVLVVKPKG